MPLTAQINTYRSQFDRPVFIVSSPRAGSTLLFETMLQAPGVHTTRRESHRLIERIEGLHPRDRGWSSNRLTADDATPLIAEELSERFYNRLMDRDDVYPTGRVRMIEKTPKNSLRISFLAEVYPDAHFLYLFRDTKPTLSSMIEAWSSGDFVTYRRLPQWPTTPWSLLLIPRWWELADKSLPEIIAAQWNETTRILLDDLAALPKARVTALDYGAFLKEPQPSLEKACATFDLGWDRPLDSPLPLSKTTVSEPSADKWKRNEAAINEVWPVVEACDARARDALRYFAS